MGIARDPPGFFSDLQSAPTGDRCVTSWLHTAKKAPSWDGAARPVVSIRARRKPSPPPRPGRKKASLYLLDLPGPDTTRAHLHVPLLPVVKNAQPLKVRHEPAPGLVVRMAHVVSRGGSFPAHITEVRHRVSRYFSSRESASRKLVPCGIASASASFTAPSSTHWLRIESFRE